MGFYRFLPLLFLSVATLSLTACESATGVGGDLIGVEAGEPQNEVLLVSTAEPDTFLDISGVWRTGIQNIPPEVLAGTVTDPMLGTISAAGLFDIGDPGRTHTTAFRNGTVTEAELRMVVNYAYGDTLTPVTLRLHNNLVELEPGVANTDTTLTPSSPIREFTFQPTDTLVTVSLPQEWLDIFDDTLRHADVLEKFHGFQVEPVSGNAVIGFAGLGIALFAVSAGDTAIFPMDGQSLYSVDFSGTQNLPPNTVAVQDGGRSVNLEINLDEAVPNDDEVISRFIPALYADTTSLISNPANFHRPLLRTLWLTLTTTSDATSTITLTLNDDGIFVPDPETNIGFFTLLAQQIALNEDEIESVTVSVPYSINSVSPALLYTPAAGPEAPRFLYTVTPTSQ
jgi:hypothetical protein